LERSLRVGSVPSIQMYSALIAILLSWSLAIGMPRHGFRTDPGRSGPPLYTKTRAVDLAPEEPAQRFPHRTTHSMSR
jgi:hypothetical protein